MQAFVMIDSVGIDKRRCECKEWLIKVKCDDRSIWNPGVCECECDKSCDFGLCEF